MSRRVVLALCGAALVAAAVVAVLVFDFGDDGSGDRPREAAVTEADNGGEVSVAANQPFVVDLRGSEDAPWGLPEATADSLARVSTSQAVDGSASATFIPLEAVPEATITAERRPFCLTDVPCDRPSERFQVTIRVVG
jgi:hypothetical protein